ncbi:MAG: hypothetical protein HYV27_02995 [Candidatus Hydrogenedentes bacterium]|nr:hypothetical protein [Candidatus Hydrogenedentota bacterium]
MAFAALLFVGVSAAAHPGPSVVIGALTESIARDGESVALLVRRAEEYRQLRDYGAALADADRALGLEPGNVPALLLSAELYGMQGQGATALALGREAVALAAGTPYSGGAWMTLSRVQEQAGDRAGALESVEKALATARPEVDWFLAESRLLAASGEGVRRLAALRAAITRNSSVVLEDELTDALIAGGAHEEAMARVEQGLAGSRFQARWLIRRARIWKALGDGESMRRDLRAALLEVAQRERKDVVNAGLAAHRAEAEALLGVK